MARLQATFMPFLYPSLASSSPRSLCRIAQGLYQPSSIRRHESTLPSTQTESLVDVSSRLDPPPEDYGRTIFADKCNLTVQAGSGGHGCISFLRAKFIPDGPPNGGDGGTGGNIYIQAISSETSLHKLARRRLIKAGRGKNGQGQGKGGQRGEDVLVQVPVGTILREVSRHDPVAEEEAERKAKEYAAQQDEGDTSLPGRWRRDKWLLYPSSLPSEYVNTEFPSLPRSRKSNLALSEPPAPISLDLSNPMEKPILLVAGAPGGMGNPHFVSRARRRPKFASKGDGGTSVSFELELKLLADVGFVGMPNAGKSTLLRALSKSRARVGNWAFTTLQPNIGTVVLDNHHGRPQIEDPQGQGGDPRTQISIADIPGLIPNAHLDRGLGLGFLRHVERAQVLAFVIDLSAGDATEALKILWQELKEFEIQKGIQTNIESEHRLVTWKPPGKKSSSPSSSHSHPYSPTHTIINPTTDETQTHIIVPPPSSDGSLPETPLAPISSKAWFVVATKADLEGTQDNFKKLETYLEGVTTGAIEHPGGREMKNAWSGEVRALPVSAIRGEGVERIPVWTLGLLRS